MACSLVLNDEELVELDDLLHQEVTTSRTELRRTRNPEFRDQINHRIKMAAHLRDLIARARAQEAAQA